MDRAELEKRGWILDPRGYFEHRDGFQVENLVDVQGIESYADARVAEALEKAAKVAEGFPGAQATDGALSKIAASIRDLKPKETPHA